MTGYVSPDLMPFLGKKRAKRASLPPLKKTVGIVRDVIGGCLFFCMVEVIAERRELMSRPLGCQQLLVSEISVHK
jgi:hypothetical protein